MTIRKTKLLWPIFLIILSVLACNLPGEMEPETSEPTPAENTKLAPTSPVPVIPLSGEVVSPDDLQYLGAFRLPEASGGSSWDYSGHGLSFYPGGDSNSPDDGFPGSLFGVGHDQQLYVSEISIPAPVNSKNLDDLNTAVTLQPFADITGGTITDELAIPRLGMEYLPPQGDQTTGKLHFAWGQHIQDFEPSHGWSELDLSHPQPAGTWVFGGYTNYVTNDYIFEIPAEWAAVNAPGMLLATGRAREGPWSGRGPALFAYAPWEDGNPPAPNAKLTTLTPLLLYGEQADGPDIVSDESTAMNGYLDPDHWWGGAWLTAGEKSAVIFVGTKALGTAWYGFSNGVVWDYDCAEQGNCPEVPEWPYDDRGYWADDYQAQIIFYDPADLGAVARGEMETWEPQPYASLDLTPYLFVPEHEFPGDNLTLIGAAAFDREHGLLYVIERLADEYKSVVHVFRVGQ
ncbi:MAG: hypothetical protein DRI56_12275 [Chloroflexota bacterium]|nr:MAG: hypothetical protein DRI56_12275 [Chloroflexota bacterium]